MEQDNKKKKTKKKKNKQQPPTKPIQTHPSSTESTSHLHHMNAQVPPLQQTSNNVTPIRIHTDGNLPNGDQQFFQNNLLTDKEHYCLHTQASFQEKLKILQTENDAKTHREALLEERIKQFLKEKDENLQKEALQELKLKQFHDEKNASMKKETSLKEKIVQLEKEKDAVLQKEGSLEQRIELQHANDAHFQKESGLEMKILQLEDEKDSWLQKEARLEEKINHLGDEAVVLNLKVVSLEEKIKQMERERENWIEREVSLEEKIKQMERERENWIERENSAKESNSSHNMENAKLRAQVTELEQSYKSLLEEKQHLEENISSLHFQIKNLESTAGLTCTVDKVISRDGDAHDQREASPALVERLIAENSELVEKVNELYGELERKSVRRGEFLSSDSGLGAVSAQLVDIVESSAPPPNSANGADENRTTLVADPISEASKMTPISGSTLSLEDIMIEDQSNGRHVNNKDASGLANSSEIIEVDEIVQIPLDENEVKESNLEVAQDDVKTEVPLIDAPLIGAPFRLISFVAKYVSGADLVNHKNTVNSGY